MSQDPYQILLEEHIIRKNAGLSTEHPLDAMYRIEAEVYDALHSNADKHDTTDHDDTDDTTENE